MHSWGTKVLSVFWKADTEWHELAFITESHELRLSLDGQIGLSESMKKLTQVELDAVRLCAQRGSPLGDANWVESTARRLNLESTLRPRGRYQVRPLPTLWSTTRRALWSY